MSPSLRIVTLALCLISVSCAHYPVNSKLLSSSSENSYRFNSLGERANSDSLFICLTFSGGGTRAAALA